MTVIAQQSGTTNRRLPFGNDIGSQTFITSRPSARSAGGPDAGGERVPRPCPRPRSGPRPTRSSPQHPDVNLHQALALPTRPPVGGEGSSTSADEPVLGTSRTSPRTGTSRLAARSSASTVAESSFHADNLVNREPAPSYTPFFTRNQSRRHGRLHRQPSPPT